MRRARCVNRCQFSTFQPCLTGLMQIRHFCQIMQISANIFCQLCQREQRKPLISVSSYIRSRHARSETPVRQRRDPVNVLVYRRESHLSASITCVIKRSFDSDWARRYSACADCNTISLATPKARTQIFTSSSRMEKLNECHARQYPGRTT